MGVTIATAGTAATIITDIGGITAGIITERLARAGRTPSRLAELLGSVAHPRVTLPRRRNDCLLLSQQFGPLGNSSGPIAASGRLKGPLNSSARSDDYAARSARICRKVM
jgi:hypothetical protein